MSLDINVKVPSLGRVPWELERVNGCHHFCGLKVGLRLTDSISPSPGQGQPGLSQNHLAVRILGSIWGNICA